LKFYATRINDGKQTTNYSQTAYTLELGVLGKMNEYSFIFDKTLKFEVYTAAESKIDNEAKKS
jgi:hypothetical protein